MFTSYGQINNGEGMSGIYRGLLLGTDGALHVWVPGIHNSDNIPSDADADKYPRVQWCAYNVQSCMLKAYEEDKMAWVMFENGDIKYPVVLSYKKVYPDDEAPDGRSGGSSGGSTNSSFGGGHDTGYQTNASNGMVFDSSHGNNTLQYIVIHSVCGPGASAQGIIDSLIEQGLGIHGIVTSTGVVQTAAWDSLQYHVGSVLNGKSIGLEMLESKYIKYNSSWTGASWSNDSEVKAFHDNVYNYAVDIAAQLVKKYNIPVANVISHAEVSQLFGGTDHGDPESLWSSFRKKWGDEKYSIEAFRNNVQSKLSQL